MRRLLVAFCFVTTASLAHAGVLVELTDGTKLTVESYWNDGPQVHLVRGGVDMIVQKSRIKSMNEDVADPEVYRGAAAENAAPDPDDLAPTVVPAAAAAGTAIADDPHLATMSESEIEALKVKESDRLLELQDARFKAAHSGTAEQQKQAEEAFVRQSQRTTQIRRALEGANDADGVPTVPRVEQPQ